MPTLCCNLSRLALVLALGASPLLAAAGECREVSAADVRLSIKAGDGVAVADALRCRKALFHDDDVRRAFILLFQGRTALQPDHFAGSRDFLESLRKAGVNFVRDLRPAVPGDGGSNLTTPLGAAVRSRNEAAVRWLLADAGGEDFAAYPMLVGEAVHLLGKAGRADEPSLLALLDAVPRGLPVDAGNHAAFRQAFGYWVASQDGIRYRDMSRFAEKPPMAPAAGEWWRSVSERIAPSDPALARKLRTEAVDAYTLGKIAQMDTLIANWRTSLDGAQGDDMVLDMAHMLSATGWASADAVRDLLGQLGERRKGLDDLRLRFGLAAVARPAASAAMAARSSPPVPAADTGGAAQKEDSSSRPGELAAKDLVQVPMMPGASFQGSSGPTRSIQEYRLPVPIREAADWYRNALPQAGWRPILVPEPSQGRSDAIFYCDPTGTFTANMLFTQPPDDPEKSTRLAIFLVSPCM